MSGKGKARVDARRVKKISRKAKESQDERPKKVQKVGAKTRAVPVVELDELERVQILDPRANDPFDETDDDDVMVDDTSGNNMNEYKKHNVHMYMDKDTGSWVRLPIAWELHNAMVKSLVDQVDEAVPAWKDRRDILSLLRACNYDPDECISIYKHLEKDEWFMDPQTAAKANASRVKKR